MKNRYASSLLYLIRETAAATWVIGPDGHVVDLPEWSALTGQTPEQIAGDGWMDAIHADDVARVRAAWMTAVAHGSHYNTDYRVRCADGVYRWFNARGVPVIDGDGGVEQWIGVLLPIAGANRVGRAAPTGEEAVAAYTDITPAALRAARAMLGWSAGKLAAMADVSLSTVRRLEDEGERDSARGASVRKLVDTLARQPVTLLASAGNIVDGVGARTGDQPRQESASTKYA